MRRRSQDNPFSLFSFQDIITGLCGIIIFLVLIMLVDIVTRRIAGSVPTMEMSASDKEQLAREIDELKRKSEDLLAQIRAKRNAAAAGLPEEERRVLEEKLKGLREKVASEKAASARGAERTEAAKVENEKASKSIDELNEKIETLRSRLETLKQSNRVTLIPEEGFSKKPLYLILSANEVEIASSSPGVSATGKFRGDAASVRAVVRQLGNVDKTRYCIVIMARPDGFERMEMFASKLRDAGFDVGRDPVEQDAELAFGEGGA